MKLREFQTQGIEITRQCVGRSLDNGEGGPYDRWPGGKRQVTSSTGKRRKLLK